MEISCKVVIWTCPDLPRPVLLSKFIIFVNNESFIAGSAGPSHTASDEEGTDKAELCDDKGSF